jgi:hypothetical protein
LSSNRRRTRGNPARQTPKKPTQQRRPATAASRPGKGTAGPGRRPLPPGETLLSRNAGPFRSAVERRSAPLLIVMHQLPRWIVPVFMAGLLLVGAIVQGVAGIVSLVILLAFVGWLSYLSWPAVDGRGRIIRLVLLGVLVALLVMQVTNL